MLFCFEAPTTQSDLINERRFTLHVVADYACTSSSSDPHCWNQSRARARLLSATLLVRRIKLEFRRRLRPSVRTLQA
jgi:hypothetical protein